MSIKLKAIKDNLYYVKFCVSTQNKRFSGHLSHSGDLLLLVGIHRHLSSVVHLLFKNYWTNHDQIWYIAFVW